MDRLLRQHLLKATDFSIDAQEELDAIAHRLPPGLLLAATGRLRSKFSLN